MIGVLFAVLYLLVGSILAHSRWADIAAECDPYDTRSVVAGVMKWVLTWPWWLRS